MNDTKLETAVQVFFGLLQVAAWLFFVDLVTTPHTLTQLLWWAGVVSMGALSFLPTLCILGIQSAK